jgi:hypothetical protein
MQQAQTQGLTLSGTYAGRLRGLGHSQAWYDPQDNAVDSDAEYSIPDIGSASENEYYRYTSEVCGPSPSSAYVYLRLP